MTAIEIQRPLNTPPALTGNRSVGPSRVEVVVAIVDPAGQTDRIEAFLPRRWATRRFRNIYEIDRPDLLVLGNATPFLVAAARLLHPQATLLALIDTEAPPRALADILHSGADACVRERALHILATHLITGHRRRTRPAYANRRAVS